MYLIIALFSSKELRQLQFYLMFLQAFVDIVGGGIAGIFIYMVDGFTLSGFISPIFRILFVYF